LLQLYFHWATLNRPEDDSIVVPLIRLPIERNGRSAEDVEKEKDRIREKILGVSNEDLFKDEETWELLETLGGDLMINAFACNFRIQWQAQHRHRKSPITVILVYILTGSREKPTTLTNASSSDSPTQLKMTRHLSLIGLCF
jgi:hypothetical protein